MQAVTNSVHQFGVGSKKVSQCYVENNTGFEKIGLWTDWMYPADKKHISRNKA